MAASEVHCMSEVGKVWRMRCEDLKLKKGTQTRQRQLEAYLQGVTAALTAAGVMTLERAAMLGFMVAVGRGEELLKPKQEEVTN